MKKNSLFVIAFCMAILTACAQGAKSPRITTDGKYMKVAYGQPSKRGRVIFGPEGLEPYGKVWRTGANQATEITFKKDGTFGGKAVKAGTYTLFTIPGEKEWTVILNSQLGQFGAFEYEKNKNKDVLQVQAKTKQVTQPIEKLTITPTDKSLTIEWDQTQVTVPVSF